MSKHQKRAFVEVVGLLLALVLAAALMPGTAHAYTQKETICNQGHGVNNASYLVIHETSNPGASACNHYKLYSRGYAYAVQYVMDLDGSAVYHTMADNRKAWAVGNGNSRCVNIELCHATNRDDFNRQWSEAVKWAGDYLNKRGWGIDRMISHNDARMRWGGSDHTDPLEYFMQYGKSWNQFKAEVAAYMKTGQVGGTVEQGATETQAPAQTSSKSMGVHTSTASALNVRSGAGTNYRVVRTYAKGTRFDLYEVKNGWGRTPSGWISLQYTTYGGGKAVAPASNSGAGTHRFKTTVNIRTGAGTGYRVVGQYKAGSTVKISRVITAGGYRWGVYTAYSGKTRYVALGVVGGKAYAA